MRLYRVRVVYESVVAASSLEEAVAVLERQRVRIVTNEEPALYVGGEIRSLSDLPDGWEGNALPWSEGEDTVADILGQEGA